MDLDPHELGSAQQDPITAIRTKLRGEASQTKRMQSKMESYKSWDDFEPPNAHFRRISHTSLTTWKNSTNHTQKGAIVTMPTQDFMVVPLCGKKRKRKGSIEERTKVFLS
jgi:hypothetical protein